jgi:transcriptional regulator with XRE-family HTH domain
VDSDPSERLVQRRSVLGFTQKEAAVRIGIDQSTLARWERGQKEPWGKYIALAERFLSGSDRRRSEARRVG